MYFSAEAIVEPTLVTLDPEPTAVVRHRGVRVEQLGALLDAGYQAVQDSGTQLADPAFAVYWGDPDDAFDLELGFRASSPVPDPQVGGLTVEQSVLPAGRAIALSHFGAYDELGSAWERVAEAASAVGLRPSCFCEIYVTDPDADPAPTSLRTDLLLIEPTV